MELSITTCMKYVNESERKTEFIREYRAGITEAYRGFTPPNIIC